MSKQRMNGGEPSHPIYLWNGILEPKHVKTIGPAIWVFLWCINRTTEERLTKEGNYDGWVLGGMPVTLGMLADELQVSEKTVSRHLEILTMGSYLRLTLAPYGYIIRVCNSCRWPKDQEQKPRIIKSSGRTKMSDHSPQTGQRGENSAPRTKVSDHPGQKCPQRSDISVPGRTKVSDVIRSISSYGSSNDQSGEETAAAKTALRSFSPPFRRKKSFRRKNNQNTHDGAVGSAETGACPPGARPSEKRTGAQQ